MKTTIKRMLALLLLLSIGISLFLLPVKAEEPTRSKYYNYVVSNAGVVSGVLYIDNEYTVLSGTGFTNAEMHTYVERRVLGLFWVKVDNGQPNKTWLDASTSRFYFNDFTLTLTQTGTYRVTAEFTFYGSNGSETLTKQSTVTY